MAEFVLNGMFSTIDLQEYFEQDNTEAEVKSALAQLEREFDSWYRSLAEYDPKTGFLIAGAAAEERLPLIKRELHLKGIGGGSGQNQGIEFSDIAGSQETDTTGNGASDDALPFFGLTPEKESLIGQISSPAFLETVKRWCRENGGGAALVLTNEELETLERKLTEGWAIQTIGLCDVILRARDSYFRFHDSPDLHRQVQLVGLSATASPVELYFLPSGNSGDSAFCIDFTDCLFRFENIRPMMSDPGKVLLLSSFCGLSPKQLPSQVQIAGLKLSRRQDLKFQYLTMDGRVHPIGCFDMALPFTRSRTLVWNIASGAAIIDTCGKEQAEYRERYRLYDVISIRTHFTGCFILTYKNGTLALWNNSQGVLLDGIDQIDDVPVDGFYRLKRLGKWGLFAGDYPLSAMKEETFCYDMLYPADNGFALVGLNAKKGTLLGVIRTDGTLLIPIQYSSVKRVRSGFFCTGNRRKNWFDMETYQHFYDLGGTCYSTSGAVWTRGLLRICDDSQNYGFINEEGEIVIPCTLTGTVFNFTEEGTALIIKDGIPSYIDTNGAAVIKQN